MVSAARTGPDGSPSDRTVAAFDFDGTISRRDTLVPFLVRVRGRRCFARATARALTEAGRSRDSAKAALLRRLLGGMPVDDFTERAEAYGRQLSAFRPEVVQRLDTHRDRGDRIVIVSASLEAFLRPVADRLGAHDLIATGLEVEDGHLTGRLAGANVRGAEKPRRLHEVLGGPPAELWAYGNSSGDRALLQSADRAVWVGRGRPLPDLTVA